MYYYFIGKDGSLGLSHEKKYRVTFVVDGPRYINAIIVKDDEVIHCPYSSVAAVLDNWSKVTGPEKS